MTTSEPVIRSPEAEVAVVAEAERIAARAAQRLAFLEAAEARGLKPRALELRKQRFLFRLAEQEESYFVGWEEEHRVHLGPWKLQWKVTRWGLFDKYAATEVVMPIAGEKVRQTIETLPGVEETAVFVERAIDPILAVRVGDTWYELYRWFSLRAHVLPARA